MTYEILIYQMPDGRQPDPTDEIIKTLTDNPLPDNHIYTLVSYANYPPLVRVQAMNGMLANAMLDTGEQISAAGPSLLNAIVKLYYRIKQQPYYCPDDKHDFFDGYYGVECRNCDWFAAYGCEPWLPVDEPEYGHGLAGDPDDDWPDDDYDDGL